MQRSSLFLVVTLEIKGDFLICYEIIEHSKILPIKKVVCLFVLFVIGAVGMHQLGFIMFRPMMKLLNIEQVFQ